MPAFTDILKVGDGNFTTFTAHTHITDDIIVEIFSSSQTGNGLVSTTIGNGAAIRGSGGTGTGVRGESDVGFGFLGGRDPVFHETAGVYGESEQAGVFGNSNSAGGTGVHGRGGGAGGFGVRGEISGTGAAAIRGQVFGPGDALAGQFDGNVRVTGKVDVTGDIRLVNGDCAENFDIGTGAPVDPGTVMVLGDEGQLFPNKAAYDKRVAGVVSGAGMFQPGIILDNVASVGNRQPVALLGKVYCKVDASYAPIEVGDLLTTSATMGHAMKATDQLKAFGSVIGKALKPFRDGRGLIPILVALQ
jgi:hypothetical protein